MKTEIEIQLSPKQIAEQLWSMDTKEIAEVFCEWNNLVIESSAKCCEEGRLNFWHNLRDVFMWMDNSHEGNEAFRELTRYLYVCSLIHDGIINESSFEKLTN